MEQHNAGGLGEESQAFRPGGQLKDNGRGSSLSEPVTRGKEAIGNAASEAMNAASADLESLRKDLNSLKDTVTKFISQAGSEAAKSARDVASNVSEQVGDVASNVADRGAMAASAANRQAKFFATELENMTRRNPLGALAAAVVVGELVGMLGRRS